MHNHDHIVALDYARTKLPKDEALCDLADLYKNLGDTTSIKILFSLFEH